MRLFPLLAALVCLNTSFAADLSTLSPVYVWPMPSALDQYLAEELTTTGAATVTLDPKLAKTVMTDRIDQSFLAGLDKVLSAEAEAIESGSIEEGQFRRERPPNRPRGAPEGTVFLVDVSTRQVVWSTFLGELDNRPKKLHQEAENVVERLEEELDPEL